MTAPASTNSNGAEMASMRDAAMPTIELDPSPRRLVPVARRGESRSVPGVFKRVAGCALGAR